MGAQNLHWEAEGAFTGEISASMLKAAGASVVIIGHSERRQLFGETDETVGKKLQAQGFSRVYRMKGGMMEWGQLQLPLVK